MKTYSIDYTKISEAESSLYRATRLMSNDCPDAAIERIKEARKLLQEFLDQDNLVEDPDLADGLVRQSDAEAAIKEAVEEAENVQKKAVDALVQMCKDTNAAKTTMSAKRPDGYIFETIIRKDGAVAFDEFSNDQLNEIEMILTQEMLHNPEVMCMKDITYLDIINICRAKLEKAEYSDIKDFSAKQKNVRQSEVGTTIKKELVDKACDWLVNHLNEYVYTDSTGIPRGDDGGLVYDFAEAMNK